MNTDKFLICPVRGITPDEYEAVREWVQAEEDAGRTIHWPERDTTQTDVEGGINICRQNVAAITQASTVVVWYNPGSSGSLFDLGAAMALGKTIRVANMDTLKQYTTEEKSFANVLYALHHTPEEE